MDKPIIEIRKLGKKYSIAHMKGGYVSLRDVLASVFKNPFSFATHKIKSAVGFAKKEEFWALKEVTFSVTKGEIIGVIGANGSGKSTLLKILTGITPPTEGEAIIRGRVGSLLEVGTGFHPELTGRDNIFLNGAILGMKRKEIAKRFDEIVAFAGIEKFLDTPVKHYSSGMYVRLAFSVAAHMDTEILLIDEVLAVGDAEFQKKCLGKMDEITKTQGRTILFVSHNLTAISQLCTKAVLLQNGKIIDSGETQKVIASYMAAPKINNLSTSSLKDRRKRTNGDVVFQGVRGIKDGKESWEFKQDEEIVFHFNCTVVREVPDVLFYMALLDPATQAVITNFRTIVRKEKVHEKEHISFSIHVPPHILRPNQFLLYFAIGNIARSTWYDVIDKNVNLPALTITSTTTDPNDVIGLFSISAKIELHD